VAAAIEKDGAVGARGKFKEIAHQMREQIAAAFWQLAASHQPGSANASRILTRPFRIVSRVANENS
jgi:hypothetical protein